MGKLESTKKVAITTEQEDAKALQKAYQKLCKAFSDLFKPELGCLKNFELEVKFKSVAKPMYCKHQMVPLTLLDYFNQAHQAEIKKEIWMPIQFNKYGVPVAPIHKAPTQEQKKANLHVCLDYSITVSHQLETHQHPILKPTDLMHRINDGYYLTHFHLTDAYNQVKLSPESHQRLALSTQH